MVADRPEARRRRRRHRVRPVVKDAARVAGVAGMVPGARVGAGQGRVPVGRGKAARVERVLVRVLAVVDGARVKARRAGADCRPARNRKLPCGGRL
jgi:hypothetical protein